MTQPGRAEVEIVGDVSKFASNLERDANRALRGVDLDLKPIERQIEAMATRVVDAIERSFAGLEETGQDTFRDIGVTAERVLDSIERDVRTATTDVALSFQRSGEVAEQAFDELRRAAQLDMERIERTAATTAASTASRFSLMSGIAGTAILGGTTALAAGLVALSGFGLKTAATLEQTQVSLESLLGSAQKGQQVFKDLQKFAAVTPFTFSDITPIAQQFLAFRHAVGLTEDDLIPFLTTLGNVASVTGVGTQGMQRAALALGQMASAGKVLQGDIRQLSTNLPGFNAVQAIAAAQGKTTAQVMEEISSGSLDAATGIRAILKGMQQFPGAAGAMERQSHTLLGVFSTFKDVFQQTLSQAFAPAIPAIKQSLLEITPIIGDALKTLAPALGQIVAGLLPFLANLIKAIGPILTPILNGLSAALTVLGPALLPLGDALGDIAVAIAPILGPLADLIKALAVGLAPVVEALKPGLAGLSELIGAGLESLLPVIEVVSKSLTDFLTPISQVLGDLFTQLAPLMDDLLGALAFALAPLLEALGPAMAKLAQDITPLIPDLVALVPPIIDLVIALTPLIELLAKSAGISEPLFKLTVALLQFLSADAVVPLLQGIADGLAAIFNPAEKLGPALGQTTGAVKDFFVGIGQFFADLPGKIGSFLAELPGMIGQFFQQMFDAGLELIGKGIGLWLAGIIALPGLLVAGLEQAKTTLLTFMANLWIQFTAGVTATVDSTVSFFTALPGRIAAGIAALPGLLHDAFFGALRVAHDAVSAGIDRIVATIQSVPGRIAALKDRMVEAGKALIHGFTSGLSAVGGFLGDVAGAIVSGLKNGLNHVIDRVNAGIATIDDALPFSLPRLPRLATGGLTQDTGLAMLHPQELVLPLESRRAVDLLAQAMAEANAGLRATGVLPATDAAPIQVRVFIGDQELKGMIRVEIDEHDRTVARRVTAGSGTR